MTLDTCHATPRLVRIPRASGSAATLVTTNAGLAAIGSRFKFTDLARRCTAKGAVAPTQPAPAPAAETPAAIDASPKDRTPRAGTKQAGLIAMLRTPEGATIPVIAAALGWQPHTVHGAMAGALKKKLGLGLGLAVASETVVGRGRVYRLLAAG